MWKPNLRALTEKRRVVTWDMRGHGRSDSPRDPASYSESASVADIAAILDACGIARAAIGGLSLGGCLSLAFHLTHPARVAALLLCDTGPGFRQGDARERWNAYAVSRAEAREQQGLAALSTSPEVGAGPHDPNGLALAARGIPHPARLPDPRLAAVGPRPDADRRRRARYALSGRHRVHGGQDSRRDEVRPRRRRPRREHRPGARVRRRDGRLPRADRLNDSTHVAPGWGRDAVLYHVYPLGLCGAPATNDGTGPAVPRLARLHDWIDHWCTLGVNALYLGPLFESSTHGYDTTDYFHVDRRLGDDDTLALL